MSTIADLIRKFGWYAVVGILLALSAKYISKAAGRAAAA